MSRKWFEKACFVSFPDKTREKKGARISSGRSPRPRCKLRRSSTCGPSISAALPSFAEVRSETKGVEILHSTGKMGLKTCHVLQCRAEDVQIQRRSRRRLDAVLERDSVEVRCAREADECICNKLR
jgi:hypothetical protein